MPWRAIQLWDLGLGGMPSHGVGSIWGLTSDGVVWCGVVCYARKCILLDVGLVALVWDQDGA